MPAASSGVPAIATRCGGPEEILDHEKTGLLVRTRDPDAIAEAVERVVNDNGLRRSLARAGRERAVASFSTDSMIAGYQQLYMDCLANQPNAIVTNAAAKVAAGA